MNLKIILLKKREKKKEIMNKKLGCQRKQLKIQGKMNL